MSSGMVKYLMFFTTINSPRIEKARSAIPITIATAFALPYFWGKKIEV
jgi:hypothetical protein